MRIAVYPGSFDPLHIGHLNILRTLTQEGEFDAVYLIVSPRNPFKSADKALNARQRYLDAIDAVARHPELSNVKVDDIELSMPSPQYTFRTLKALREREPGNDFTLVIGADNLASFRGWRNYRRILLDYGLVVFPREGVDSSAVRADLLAENQHYRIRIENAPTVDVSSTQIRKSASGEADGLLM